jgi:hypothetical protein
MYVRWHRRLCVTIVLSIVVGASASAADSPVVPLEQWSNVTAGEEVTLHFRLQDAASGQVVGWSVAVDTAVIARGQSEVRANANRQPVLTLKFQLPEGETNSVVPVAIRVARNGREVPAKRLWIYPSDPFQQPIPHLPAEPLVLFDPQRTTAARFEKTPLRFRLEKNVDALAGLQDGVLVIGEGVSFRQYRGLPNVIRNAAARGVKVLCLSPSAGTLVLSTDDEGQPDRAATSGQVMNLNLARSDVLARFDKHLDAADWRGASPVGTTTLQLVSRLNQLSAEVAADADGWPWLEAEYAGGGRIIVCGFRPIGHWESGPAPRHALWHFLAQTVRPTPATELDSNTFE